MSFIINLLVRLRLALRRTRLGLLLFKFSNRKKERFACPFCGYSGPFADVSSEGGIRKNATCPACGSLERHRLQCLVIERLAERYDFSQMSILHFAPEPFFANRFRKLFRDYTSADLSMKTAEVKADLRHLPFEADAYDFVFASHVLEHIKEDAQALEEIRRVLRPGGIAVLPVPIVAEHTVEYPGPNPHEIDHVRAPGPDYYDKYALYFKTVERFDSSGFPAKYQTFIYEDRSTYPPTMPLRPRMPGYKHADIVPVCVK